MAEIVRLTMNEGAVHGGRIATEAQFVEFLIDVTVHARSSGKLATCGESF